MYRTSAALWGQYRPQDGPWRIQNKNYVGPQSPSVDPMSGLSRPQSLIVPGTLN